MLAAAVVQVLMAVPFDGTPCRFGVPVEHSLLQRGIGADGGARLGWRDLGLRQGALRWIEVSLVGGHGTVRVRCRDAAADRALPDVLQVECEGETVTWRFCDGTVDQRQRVVFTVPTECAGEIYSAGEARTLESLELAARSLPVLSLPRRIWERAGLLPPDAGLGRRIRDHLLQAASLLQELPGERGAGDYARSRGIVTNLEFDMPLALLRLALATGEPELLLRARRSALHLLDRDLDRDTGLPFPHGPHHRSGWPEPGHAWLTGLLWTGAVTADDLLLDGARALARALAAQPAVGDGPLDRARDHGWPLLELEHYLAWCEDPVVAKAADRLALHLQLRYAEELRTFRFGEGELGSGVYLERAWLTGGIVLPALQAHLRRRPDATLQRMVDAAVQQLLDRIGEARRGLPTQWRWGRRGVFAEHFAAQDPRAFLLLEALPVADLRRLLRRRGFLDLLLETPQLEDPDLPTSFTMVARCAWIYR